MAHKQNYLAQRAPGIESKLDSLVRLVKVLAVLAAVVHLAANWEAAHTLQWRASLILDAAIGLLVALIVAALLQLLAQHHRLRRHELGFEYDGELEREAEYRVRCSECAKPAFTTDARCTNCGAEFDEVEPVPSQTPTR